MKDMKRLTVGLVFAAVMALGSVALADTTGYVCTVTNRTPGSSSDGPGGYLQFSMYSGASCSGSFLSWFTIYSSAATDGSSIWPAPVPFEHTFQMLMQAVLQNKRVTVTNYGGFLSSVPYYVTLLAD